MFSDKEAFKKAYIEELEKQSGKPAELCRTREKYEALSKLMVGYAAKTRAASYRKPDYKDKKCVYYFSMEFLVGRLMKSQLINAGIYDIAVEGLRDLGTDIEELCECEADPGLGNGGLGRLAACFMDSLSYMGINAVGVGVRYKYGLFRQRITSGWQTEDVDNWLENAYPWESRRAGEEVIVKFGGDIERTNGGFNHTGYSCVRAIPYDVPLIGYGGENVNILELWSAAPMEEKMDLDAFRHGDYGFAQKHIAEAEAICSMLYPDDSTHEGRILRLKQEYFFVCAGLSALIRKYKRDHNTQPLKNLPDYVSIHINDTHPSLCVPELMRILMDDEGLSWEDAWDITTRAISYTNHTVLPEALEKWPVHIYKSLLPRVYMITEEIDRRYRESVPMNTPNRDAMVYATAPLRDGNVHMANLTIIGSHSVNGVAGIHTEILKTDTLKEFYAMTPDKFNNKTNGVSHRRFLHESNMGLSRLITNSLGSDAWLGDMDLLKGLEQFKDDGAFLDELMKVKRENKLRLAEYIYKKNHIKVDPDSVFDIQVKRIHAYKRQHLNILRVLDLYNKIKANPHMEVTPHTFIFSGKAASSYAFAKQMIKLICSVADIVNADPEMEGKMKVVFLENFSVSMAQVIYPAADISEQISTAGKEASGTGNMKFMMNGALTLGTLDGANVEIKSLVGDENIRIFGLTAEEVYAQRSGGYNARAAIEANPALVQMCDQMTNGFFAGSGTNFDGFLSEIISKNDEYFLFADFDSYVRTWREMCADYADKRKWAKMSLMNIANSGWFSSDRTVGDYWNDIWGK